MQIHHKMRRLTAVTLMLFIGSFAISGCDNDLKKSLTDSKVADEEASIQSLVPAVPAKGDTVTLSGQGFVLTGDTASRLILEDESIVSIKLKAESASVASFVMPDTKGLAINRIEIVKDDAIVVSFDVKKNAQNNKKLVEAPLFSIAEGAYGPAQTVTLSTSTPNAIIYYTVDGSNPNVASDVYSDPLDVSTSQTIKAFAAKTAFINSEIVSATYTINGAVEQPTFSVSPGTYAAGQSVTLATSTADAIIHYTTEGTTPSLASAVYSSAVNVSSSQTLKAIAVKSGFSHSAVASAIYVINGTVAAPTFSVAAGGYGPTQSVSLSSLTTGATIYYTTDGSTPTTSSTLYTGAINVAASQTIKALAVKANHSDSSVASAAYSINGAAATPSFSVAAGTYGPSQSVTMTSATPGSTIFYTTDGSTPTASSTTYSGAVNVSSTQTLKAIAVKAGFSDSAVTSAAYTINGAVAAPTFSVAAGGYGPAQSVTLSSLTAAATIYYTVDGSTPTISSTLYTGAINVAASQTIKAFAVKANYSDSSVASAAYTINGAVATPTASLAAGLYFGTQSVTLSTVTAGASIYYTTDGNTPTSGSTAYAGAISITANTTLKFIALKSEFSDSSVATATYNILTKLDTTISGTSFDGGIKELPVNGNIVVSATSATIGGNAGAGAVYLFNGTTGALISTLTGSTASDGVGTVTALSNGNFVVVSFNWDNGAVVNAGAVTWCSGTTGCNGAVSSANSMVGSTNEDKVGLGTLVELTNSNYAFSSANWDNGAATDAGAVTWCDGSTGICKGEVAKGAAVSATNSLVGSTASDFSGASLRALTNGNYIVAAKNWDATWNAALTNVGSVTWCSGTSGCSGTISAATSLVGSDDSNSVGFTTTPLTNGDYIVASAQWDCRIAIGCAADVNDVGAVTLCSGTTGICNGEAAKGASVSPTNSLVGSSLSDGVGSVLALSNGNYIVHSRNWDNGASTDVGAVTWCSGSSGCTGTVTAANSLIGSTNSDSVGYYAFALTNGHYVTSSHLWDGGAVDVGAVTWCNGTTGICKGETVKGAVVSAANSLVGSTLSDGIGGGSTTVNALSNGNYVVSSANWDNGVTGNVGAATWCDGTSGCAGAISSANSLIGSTSNDGFGMSFTALSNGNYLVRNYSWDNGPTADVGAVTWCSGTAGCTGTISAATSLIGSTLNDNVGFTAPALLSNGHYVVISSSWDNGVANEAGATTWCSGTTGICAGEVAKGAVVSSANSLVGSSATDGFANVVTLSNGNYIVSSPTWDNGGASNAGAVRWCSGTAGCTGAASSANSIVGSTSSDGVSSVTALTNGNYIIRGSNWDDGATIDVGAVMWCSGVLGCSGTFSASNSVIGSTASDKIGFNGATALSNGKVVLRSASFGNPDSPLIFIFNGTSQTAGSL